MEDTSGRGGGGRGVSRKEGEEAFLEKKREDQTGKPGGDGGTAINEQEKKEWRRRRVTVCVRA